MSPIGFYGAKRSHRNIFSLTVITIRMKGLFTLNFLYFTFNFPFRGRISAFPYPPNLLTKAVHGGQSGKLSVTK